MAYVQLDGLGRVPFSNVRRPKPIMDLGGPRAPAATSEGELEGKLQPLEKEPLLAARIMIEDAMCLLLDVQDIDRLLHSQQALEHPAALHQRRTLLLEGAFPRPAPGSIPTGTWWGLVCLGNPHPHGAGRPAMSCGAGMETRDEIGERRAHPRACTELSTHDILPSRAVQQYGRPHMICGSRQIFFFFLSFCLMCVC